MLSAESATGKHPQAAVAMMSRIIEGTEADPQYRQLIDASHSPPCRVSRTRPRPCCAMRHAAALLKAAAIVCFTSSGATSLRGARTAGGAGAQPHAQPGGRAADAVWGVHSVHVDDVADIAQSTAWPAPWRRRSASAAPDRRWRSSPACLSARPAPPICCASPPLEKSNINMARAASRGQPRRQDGLDHARTTPCTGVPRSMEVALYATEGDDATLIRRFALNHDGRSDQPLYTAQDLKIGTYRLVFDVAGYFRQRGVALPEQLPEPGQPGLRRGARTSTITCRCWSAPGATPRIAAHDAGGRRPDQGIPDAVGTPAGSFAATLCIQFSYLDRSGAGSCGPCARSVFCLQRPRW